ncbi:MAG: hypothetical protein AAGG75_25525 [Bacteroidota bacterium]
MYIFNVEVEIRKGLGPEWVTKNFIQAYDDVPEEVPESEVKKWAVADTEKALYNSEDYPWYGKNWIIVDVYGS